MSKAQSITLTMNLDLAVKNLKLIGALKEDCNIDDVKHAINNSVVCRCNETSIKEGVKHN